VNRARAQDVKRIVGTVGRIRVVAEDSDPVGKKRPHTGIVIDDENGARVIDVSNRRKTLGQRANLRSSAQNVGQRPRHVVGVCVSFRPGKT